MSAVERKAVFLSDVVVPIALQLVDVLGHKALAAVARLGVGVGSPWDKRLLAFSGVRDGGSGAAARGGWGRWFLEMETEERVGVEVVERCPGAVPVVGEFGVGAIAGHGEAFPFGYVFVGSLLDSRLVFDNSRALAKIGMWVVGAYLVVLSVVFHSDDCGDLAHCFDSDDSLEREVGLQCKPAGKVIG